MQARLGLRFDPDSFQLEQALLSRVSASGGDREAYLGRLGADPQAAWLPDPGRPEELTALSAELTVGETYFLRHLEQFRALTEQVLPERAGRHGPGGRLRLLSAGCATGEEAYSLAIAARTSVPGTECSILGTDLNGLALAKARAGRYTSWSMRAVPDAVRDRWFSAESGDLVLDPAVRAQVTFECHNLGSEEADLWRPQTYDVVFCRNVLMYFAPEVMAGVLHRIAGSLQPGGYLFLGSAESLRGLRTDFELRQAHGAFFYQLPDPDRGAPLPGLVPKPRATFEPVRAAPARPETRSPGSEPASTEPGTEPGTGAERVATALELLRQDRFAQALAALGAGEDDGDAGTRLLRAVLLVHCGSFGSAERICRRLLSSGGWDPLHADAHLLLASCREFDGDLAGAVEHLRKASTVDPLFAIAHMHLGRIARRQGGLATAHREYARSVELLAQETEHRILLFGGGFDRAGLISLCEAQGAAARSEG